MNRTSTTIYILLMMLWKLRLVVQQLSHLSKKKNTFHFLFKKKKSWRKKRAKMALDGETKTESGNEKQVSKHQEVGHKSLLQSDALYQVRCSLFNYCKDDDYGNKNNRFKFLFAWFYSIFLKRVCIHANRNPWRSLERSRQNIHGKSRVHPWLDDFKTTAN